MKAILINRQRIVFEEELRAELLLWRVPTPVLGSSHFYKYRLALIDRDVCVLRYDNEAGKGDHRHIGDVELPYFFTTVEELSEDFLREVERYRRGGRR